VGAAHNQRGVRNLTRPFQEASDTARWIDDCMNLYVASIKCVERCRDANALLAEIAAHKGVRYAAAKAALAGHVGQVRRAKYLAAVDLWRDQRPGRREWCAAIDMDQARKSLLGWLGV
jgi:hypothetical protein